MPSRLVPEVRRLCKLGQPLPTLVGLLSPILRAGFEASHFSLSVLGSDGTVEFAGLSDAPLPKACLDLIDKDLGQLKLGRLTRVDRESCAGTGDVSGFGECVQNIGGKMSGLVGSRPSEAFSAPMNAHHGIRIALHRAGRPAGFALLTRCSGERPFNTRETDAFVMLAPWLSQALDVAPCRADAACEVPADEGSAILDAEGRVLYRCADARRHLYMLAHADGRSGGLGGGGVEPMLARLARNCLAIQSGRPLLPPIWRGATAWGAFTLIATPLLDAVGVPSGMVALRLCRKVPRVVRAAGVLARDTRLTSRQKDICLALVEGLSRGEIAQRLDIGVSTVITHTRGLYARLGAESREHMMRIVLAGAEGDAPISRVETPRDSPCAAGHGLDA